MTGKLHVAPGAHLLGDQRQVVLVGHVVAHGPAVGIAQAQVAVVEVHRAVLAHQAQQARLEAAEMIVERRIGLVQPAHHVHRAERPRHHLLDLGGEQLTVGHGEVAIDAAGHRRGAMDTLAGGGADHLLAKLAQQHLARDIRMRLRHADDVALPRRRAETEQQVRARQVEEVQRVRLQDLPVVHQPAHLVGGGGDRHRAHHRSSALAAAR